MSDEQAGKIKMFLGNIFTYNMENKKVLDKDFKVERKALSFLITLDKSDAKGVKDKIKRNNVIVATEP